MAKQTAAPCTSSAPTAGIQGAPTQPNAASSHIVDVLVALGPDASEVDLDRAVNSHLDAGFEVLLSDIQPFYLEPMRRRKATTGADVSAAAALLDMAHGTKEGERKLANGLGEWANRVTIERKHQQ